MLVDPLLPALARCWERGRRPPRRRCALARERAALAARFAHRLPPGVAAALLALPEAERLRPERRQVAVVITDLAGFSGMLRRAQPGGGAGAERLPRRHRAIVVAEGGTLERLIGDSVLAVFGAPLPQPDHGARALARPAPSTASPRNSARRPEAVAIGWGETRIGLAAGEVLAGEVGGSASPGPSAAMPRMSPRGCRNSARPWGAAAW